MDSICSCWPRAVPVPAPESHCGVFTLLVRSSGIESRGGTSPREYDLRRWVFSCRGAVCKIRFCSPELHFLFCAPILTLILTFVNRFCIIYTHTLLCELHYLLEAERWVSWEKTCLT